MPRFSAIESLCRQDGICASVCPAHVIKGPKGKTPFMRPDRQDSCIACGQCMAFCPFGAARVDVLDPSDMLPLERSKLPDAESLSMLFQSRRSIRHFKKEPVARELLQHILDETRHAPSAKNRRAVRWIMVYEPEKMRAVGDCAVEGLTHGLQNPETGPVLAEAKALIKAWGRGLDPLFRGAPHLALAVAPSGQPLAREDAVIALTYLELAALPYKVGACWAGYITGIARQYEPMQRLLGLGPDEEVSGGQMLGHIGLRPTASAPRVPFATQWL